MVRITNLKDKLQHTDPCPEVWATKAGRYPRCEVGYLRSYHDGFGWFSNYFDVNPDLSNESILTELGQVGDAFMRSFKNLRTMTKWCIENADSNYDSTEFNAWYIGTMGIYRFRMITRRGDYNLYLHCLDRKAIREVNNNA